MSDASWDEDPAAKVWIRQVLNDMLPNLESSAVVMSIVPGDREGDVKFWVELGASIMLDKPIIAVVLGDRPLPPKLEAIADEIVRCPDGIDPASSDEMRAALERLAARLP